MFWSEHVRLAKLELELIINCLLSCLEKIDSRAISEAFVLQGDHFLARLVDEAV